MPSSMSSPWSVGVGVDLRTFRKADAVEQKMARLVLDGRRTYATFFTTILLLLLEALQEVQLKKLILYSSNKVLLD
jgi:hypothetical protein